MSSTGIKAIGDHIIAKEGNFGSEISEGGIYIQKTIGKTEGIVPRWFKVVDVGPEDKLGLVPGEWVLVANGRWTEGFKLGGIEYWRLDPNGCLVVSEERPKDINLADENRVAHTHRKKL